jgi:extradiol dioxygenase family protein
VKSKCPKPLFVPTRRDATVERRMLGVVQLYREAFVVKERLESNGYNYCLQYRLKFKPDRFIQRYRTPLKRFHCQMMNN